eukprot:c24501_g1_i1 orf=1-705(+)
MSLALVQDYSSEEDCKETFLSDSDADGSDDEPVSHPLQVTSKVEASNPSRASLLPSAHDIFSKVKGPPDFLKSSIADPIPSQPHPRATPKAYLNRFSKSQSCEDQAQRIPPANVVVEAKAQLVGLHDRVQSDLENTSRDETRPGPTVGLPPAEDVANLLRVCLECGVPKTYSAAREGMVCPLCKDQPIRNANIEAEKKRGSKIKEKERVKRMKGQSTHATWKSETEMQLRQQFD